MSAPGQNTDLPGALRIRGLNLPHLDGVRGLAILLVMLHHFTQGHPAAGDLGQSIVFGIGEIGWTGVDLFFVLSGFLITSILLESREGRGYFGRFFSRRFLRIFPLYYASLAVVFFVLPHLGTTLPLPDPDDQHWYWLYLANVHIALHAWQARTVTHFWSLAIEEHFYLVWPFVVKWVTRRGTMIACLVLIAVATISRGALWSMTHDPVPAYVLTFTRLDLLAAGGLLAGLSHGEGGVPACRVPAWFSGLFGALGFAAFVLHDGVFDWGARHLAAQLFCGWVTAALSVWLLVVAIDPVQPRWARTFLNLAPLRMLGRYSYGLYVVHVVVDEACRRGVPSIGLPIFESWTALGTILTVGLRLTLSMGLAYLSYHAFEKWFLRLKR